MINKANENSEKNLALAKTKLDTETVRKPTKLSELNPDKGEAVIKKIRYRYSNK